MKKLLLFSMLLFIMAGCKKDQSNPQPKQYIVTYTFVPNGLRSSMTYNLIKDGKQHGEVSTTTFTDNDLVKPGDEVQLLMRVDKGPDIPGGWEVRIQYGDKILARNYDYKVDADGIRYIKITKIFVQSDFD